MQQGNFSQMFNVLFISELQFHSNCSQVGVLLIEPSSSHHVVLPLVLPAKLGLLVVCCDSPRSGTKAQPASTAPMLVPGVVSSRLLKQEPQKARNTSPSPRGGWHNADTCLDLTPTLVGRGTAYTVLGEIGRGGGGATEIACTTTRESRGGRTQPTPFTIIGTLQLPG